MYDKNNIFAKMIRGEVEAEKIYEDQDVFAINDIQPLAPVHILVIPKGEYTSFDDFSSKASVEEIAHFFKIVNLICKNLKLQDNGYRIVSNVARHGMQTVLHMHLHILAGDYLGKPVG
ncbi:MAG: HIT domain-containing protein [Rickettsiales bacterium]